MRTIPEHLTKTLRLEALYKSTTFTFTFILNTSLLSSSTAQQLQQHESLGSVKNKTPSRGLLLCQCFRTLQSELFILSADIHTHLHHDKVFTISKPPHIVSTSTGAGCNVHRHPNPNPNPNPNPRHYYRRRWGWWSKTTPLHQQQRRQWQRLLLPTGGRWRVLLPSFTPTLTLTLTPTLKELSTVHRSSKRHYHRRGPVE